MVQTPNESSTQAARTLSSQADRNARSRIAKNTHKTNQYQEVFALKLYGNFESNPPQRGIMDRRSMIPMLQKCLSVRAYIEGKNTNRKNAHYGVQNSVSSHIFMLPRAHTCAPVRKIALFMPVFAEEITPMTEYEAKI